MIDGTTKASHHRLIDCWLDARDELMGLFADLTNGPAADIIEDFRSALMDYVCAGHFEVYERLVADTPTPESRGLLRSLYPAIHDSTEAALVFDDVCTVPESAEELTLLLADLGLRLEERFLLEDQLIAGRAAEPELATGTRLSS